MIPQTVLVGTFVIIFVVALIFIINSVARRRTALGSASIGAIFGAGIMLLVAFLNTENQSLPVMEMFSSGEERPEPSSPAPPPPVP